MYWTNGIFNSTTRKIIWHGTKNADTGRKESSVNYTNWGPGYPAKLTRGNNVAILLNCRNLLECKWEVHDTKLESGVMCEAPLESNKNDSSGKPRKAPIQEFELSTEQTGQLFLYANNF